MVRRNILLHPGFIYTRRTNRQSRASKERIKVLLAYGHTLLREGLGHLLEHEDDIQVVGQAADWPQAAGRCRLLTPDVLVADISLPPAGFKGLAELAERRSGPRILLLALSPSQEKVREAVRAGVPGILVNCDSAELAQCIRALYRGGSFFSAEVLNLMASEPEPPSCQERLTISLTAGEEEVLHLVAQGLSNRQIAEALSVSPKTVRNRLSLLFRKLGVRNRTEAALYALREGLAYLDRVASPVPAGGHLGPTSYGEA